MASRINLLFIGDIVGAPGVKGLQEHLPKLKEKYNPNLIVFNGENTSNGKGIVEEEAKLFFEMGADIITTGNHIWDNWKSRPLIAKDKRIIRPLNYPQGNAGYGYTFHEVNGIRVCVLQLQGRTFMQAIDCPFKTADYILAKIKEQSDIVIIDFHAEATAEKYALAWHLDGKVSAILGTHTHIQTADAQILPKGTAYISDVGMTGPYESVVGMKKEVALKRFLLQTAHRYELAESDVKVNGVFVSIDAETGQAYSIEAFAVPDFVRNIGF